MTIKEAEEKIKKLEKRIEEIEAVCKNWSPGISQSTIEVLGPVQPLGPMLRFMNWSPHPITPNDHLDDEDEGGGTDGRIMCSPDFVPPDTGNVLSDAMRADAIVERVCNVSDVREYCTSNLGCGKCSSIPAVCVGIVQIQDQDGKWNTLP